MASDPLKRAPIGRLAMRVEGRWWVAYLAPLGSMNGAVEIGRVRIRLGAYPAIKAATFAYFQGVMTELIKERIGATATWPDGPIEAPEHEKSGNA